MGSHRFIVTDGPPWYETKGGDYSFTCNETQGLFDRVVQMMTEKHSLLQITGKRYQPKTVQKLVRDMVIKDAGQIKQNPSRSLLLALMDIVDLHGSTEAECMSHNDRAGTKELVLTIVDYILYYIPSEVLNRNGVKIIPVATHYSQPKNLRFCDITRSMLGTYMVDMTVVKTSVFMQQVLYVPGSNSLKLLKEIIGDKSEFWDMSLEVPTHPEALRPSFIRIQPARLLRSEGGTSSEPGNANINKIKPMCCVFDKASTEAIDGKHEGSVDCFTDDQIWQNMNDFICDTGVKRTVYFRKRSEDTPHLLLCVLVRKEQISKSTIYISTTVSFCRALKVSLVKGKSILLKCCHTTLKELLGRKTFLVGPEIYQDILKPALTALMNQKGQRSTPKYFDSVIKDPIMIEIIDLGINLMDSRIPNALVIAELLHCPLNKVEEYVNFYKRYSSDKAFEEQVNRTTICTIEAQMRETWQSLVGQVKTYTGVIYGDKPTMKAQIDQLFECDFHGAWRVQKEWESLVNQLSNTEKEFQDQSNLEFLRYNTNVLFHSLQVYQNKLNTLPKFFKGGGESSLSSEEPHMSKSPEKCNTITCMVIPDQPPISTWIKHMATLLLSPAWLYSDCELRRDAVCDILGLEKTLLHKDHSDSLHQWVQYNTTVVDRLRGLQDRLSKALINCLDRTSITRWIPMVQMSLGNTQRKDNVSGGKSETQKTVELCVRDEAAYCYRMLKRLEEEQESARGEGCSHEEKVEPIGDLANPVYHGNQEDRIMHNTIHLVMEDGCLQDRYCLNLEREERVRLKDLAHTADSSEQDCASARHDSHKRELQLDSEEEEESIPTKCTKGSTAGLK